MKRKLLGSKMQALFHLVSRPVFCPVSEIEIISRSHERKQLTCMVVGDSDRRGETSAVLASSVGS